MANRLFDNIILVDSAMGNLSIVGGASNNLTSYRISALSFWSADTSGNCIFSGADTTNWVWRVSNISAVVGSGAILQSTQSISFPGGLELSDLKIPTLTAGTGWVYLA